MCSISTSNVDLESKAFTQIGMPSSYTACWTQDSTMILFPRLSPGRKQRWGDVGVDLLSIDKLHSPAHTKLPQQSRVLSCGNFLA